MSSSRACVSVVVLTYNRREELLQTLQCLTANTASDAEAGSGSRPPIIVVDNHSNDGTAQAVQQQFPDITVLRTTRNLGAAGRNLGAKRVQTPYVAFCDDDTCWEPGSIALASKLLQQNPDIAVVSARIVVGEERRADPNCEAMARSPLGCLPQGPLLLGFMAGACVMRTASFRAAGGYWPPFFIGGEEELLALDFAAQGWHMVYAPQVVTRHSPSKQRDVRKRQSLLTRNGIWTAWLRLPLKQAWRESWRAFSELPSGTAKARTLLAILAGMPRVLRARKAVPAHVVHMRALLSRQPHRARPGPAA